MILGSIQRMSLAQLLLFYSLIGAGIWWAGISAATAIERPSEASGTWLIDTPMTISGYTWTRVELDVTLGGRFIQARGALATDAGHRLLGSGTCVAEQTITCSILMGSLHLMIRMGQDLNGVLDVYQVSTQAHGGTFGVTLSSQ